ncbi:MULTISPECIES: peroxiredoxin [Mameliella]|uniref:peroxiredoxin n=1 Tax=Mameliella TaxID=1434019 RepID=UPI0008410A5C|nr:MULTISPECIES: peroxiredoxin [Mameliella]ODM46174.1 peroxiredoxin [Ruegeria sp. PBVC088]MBY6122563.1 peroxiredoxin [Mameliella alba]MDD9731500.1 peroxiredoxin [Mameliella sp. AT18]OWV39368.1 peroxiredoxin [Mameliella alba]OWV41209.1 peroxiredoxin [Mameliella alba]
MTPQRIPETVFHTRQRNEALGGDNPYEWKDVTSAELFDRQRVVLFALPGAFTPACSETHLPGYERHYDAFRARGIDRVICLSVNDAFVMHQWARAQGIEKVMMLPDGNGDFTRLMGMLVDRSAQGMGLRSWRYAMLVEDGEITALFAEPGVKDNPPGVPVKVSGAETMLAHLEGG